MPGTTEIVDILIITIQRREPNAGSVRFEDAVNFEVTATQESRPRYTLRRDRTARGFGHGARTCSGQLEVVVPKGGNLIDFESMQRNKEAFDILVERGVEGQQVSCLDTYITEVNETGSGEGEHTFRVSFVCADYRKGAGGL